MKTTPPRLSFLIALCSTLGCACEPRGDDGWEVIAPAAVGVDEVPLLPTLDAVVVFTHQVFENPLGEVRNMAMLELHVLPALVGKGTASSPYTPTPAELQKFVGTYEAEDGSSPLVTSLRDGMLLANDPQMGPQVLVPDGERRFRVRVFDMLDIPITFVPDIAGGIEGARSHTGFRERTFRRAK